MVFLRSHDLADLVDGDVSPPPQTLSDGSPNPAYTAWSKKDTCVLSWLLASITEKLVSTVYGMKTSRQVWDAFHTWFSSTSRSRIALLKRQLQTITQGHRSCSDFMEEAKGLVDQLAAAGKPTDDQDLISFLLGGLRPTFSPFITSFNFASCDNDLSFDDFQAELLSFETLIDAQANSVTDQHYAFAAHQKWKAPNFPRKTKSQTPLRSSLQQSLIIKIKAILPLVPINMPMIGQPVRSVVREAILPLTVIIGLTSLFRDGCHLLILLPWLLKPTTLMINMSGQPDGSHPASRNG
ncbi:hypothetical protein F0562_011155 [Nyssa sinensis]|uniref:Retrotransposon gag domain-containing protein n=1 Tax=Nyssa sinensis TaxID=561372 RepID=A0A5J5A4G2_9ASTE|nr:hypothetical protein F0562_011155 [Nyssa sinensis]